MPIGEAEAKFVAPIRSFWEFYLFAALCLLAEYELQDQ
jgi:hypothetical protein